MENKNYSVVVYDKDKLINGIEYLKNNKTLISYAYILHNLDVNENGELKKEHYHLYLCFNNRTRDSIIRKLFNTEIVQCCKNPNNYICYFLHLFDKDKTQYKKENIISYNLNIEEILNSSFNKYNNDNEILFNLIEYITINKLNYKDTFIYCCKNNILTIYKEYYYIIKDIIRFG